MRILCIYILLLPALKTYSPNSVLASVQFVPEGSAVKIPCDGYVTAVELTDSPQDCNLYCDVDVNAVGNPVTVVADKWNISITGIIKKPKSSVICRLHSSSVETDRIPLAAESTTQTGRNSTRGGQTMTRSSGGEDENQVVYSMLDGGRHQQQNVITSDNECVYSQIKVSLADRGADKPSRVAMEAPPVTVMPVTGGTINMMEYLLQGSVLDQSLDSLLHRLRGLCDNMEPESFADHELVYLLKGQQGNPFILRARRSLAHPTAPWHLRYLGQPEVGDKSRHALVRNCVDVAASHSLPDFLNEMGFRMDHEFVAKGHIFRKVELSVLAPAGQDTVSEDMRSFAEQLKPLVHLEKIDPKRLICHKMSCVDWGRIFVPKYQETVCEIPGSTFSIAAEPQHALIELELK
ncbi:hypothetical protein AOLI_G00050020 [Acnodon oligacanthus]